MKRIITLLLLLAGLNTQGQTVEWFSSPFHTPLNTSFYSDLTRENSTGQIIVCTNTQQGFNTAQGNLAGKGGWDYHLVKLNQQGVIIWQKTFGGPSNERVDHITIDENDHIILSGLFMDSTTADNLTIHLGTPRTNGPFNGSFLLKLNTDGEVLWLKKTSNNGLSIGKNCITDTKGNIYVTGLGDETFITTKYTPDGNEIVSVNHFYVLPREQPSGLYGYKDDIYLSLTGRGIAKLSTTSLIPEWHNEPDFIDNVMHSPSPKISSKTPEYVFGSSHTYMGDSINMFDSIPMPPNAKLFKTFPNCITSMRSDGKYRWVHIITGPGGFGISALESDRKGYLIMCGYFKDSIIFDDQHTLRSHGGMDAFLAVCDPAGNWILRENFGGAGDEFAHSVNLLDDATILLHLETGAPVTIGTTTSNAINGNTLYAKIRLNGIPLSTKEQSESTTQKPTLYPNPCDNKLNLDLQDHGAGTYQVSNIIGEAVMTFNTSGFELNKQIDTGLLPAALIFFEEKPDQAR